MLPTMADTGRILEGMTDWDIVTILTKMWHEFEYISE